MPNQVTNTQALTDYQRSLDHVYERSHELMADAPSWQAALLKSLLACYTEMSQNPECLRLHFVTTGQNPDVQRIRSAHRDRLLGLLGDVRDDAPPTEHSEMRLNMIHQAMRSQVISSEVPPDLDAAEGTFAKLLFAFDGSLPGS